MADKGPSTLITLHVAITPEQSDVISDDGGVFRRPHRSSRLHGRDVYTRSANQHRSVTRLSGHLAASIKKSLKSKCSSMLLLE